MRPDPLKVKQILRVRKTAILSAYNWLKSHNLYYRDTCLNNTDLEKLPEDDVPDILVDNYTYIDIKDKNNTGYDNVNRDLDLEDQNFESISMTHSCLSNNTESLTLDLIDEINLLHKSYDKRKTQEQNDQHEIIDNKWCLTMPHSEQPVTEINNPSHLINAFPTLFAYGIGGISDKRRRKTLSYREHVKYLLQLNCDRFRTHRSFIFVVFNILQRSEARNRINLLVKQQDYDKFCDEINLLTEKDFEEAVKTVNINPKAKYNSSLHKLLKKVHSASTSIQGSRAALSHRRNEIRAYMIYFGTPHFFITINPCDIHSPYLLRIGGVEIKPNIIGTIYIAINFIRINYSIIILINF